MKNCPRHPDGFPSAFILPLRSGNSLNTKEDLNDQWGWILLSSDLRGVTCKDALGNVWKMPRRINVGLLGNKVE
ncbi:unnamed protein product, partial [Gulo gulo]